MQVVVKSTNGSIVVNKTLLPDVNDMTLVINPELAQPIAQYYAIQIAAVNQVGHGPFSSPLQLEFDPIVVISESESEFDSDLFSESNRQIILIIGLISAATFVLILVSAVICYNKKFNSSRKPIGYLPASTSDDFHCQLNRQIHLGGGESSGNHPIIINNSRNSGRNSEFTISTEKRNSQDASLWIDRRWGGAGSDSCEKDSNSSEKKLLNLTSHQNNTTHSNSNSDTEYAYVENKHNVSSFTNSSGGSRKTAESPEPYATTEIFKQHVNNSATQQQKSSQQNHYAAPIIVPSHYRRNVHSCDDLTDNLAVHGMTQQYAQSQHYAQHYHMPQNYQRASTGGGKMRRNKPKNILDIIPPPPLHPPPPHPPTAVVGHGGVYNKSQESVISPKYLFAHPMYQGTNSGTKQVHKVHPISDNIRSQNQNNVYEQVDNRRKNQQQQQRVVFDRDFHDELQNFNAVMTQFNNSNSLASSNNNIDQQQEVHQY